MHMEIKERRHRDLDLEVGERELDVLVDAHVRIEGVVLEDEADATFLR